MRNLFPSQSEDRGHVSRNPFSTRSLCMRRLWRTNRTMIATLSAGRIGGVNSRSVQRLLYQCRTVWESDPCHGDIRSS